MPKAKYIINSSVSSPAADLVAEATWVLFADDALESGGILTNWIAQKGPDAGPAGLPFGTPTIVTRPDLNNKKAVRFDRTLGDLLLVNGDVNPVIGDHTLLIFYHPDKGCYYSPSNAERSYITSANNGSIAGVRLALGVHTANDQRVTFSHRYRGFATEAADGDSTPAAGWHTFNDVSGAGFTFSIGGPQCAVSALSDPGGGGAQHYIDGQLRGSNNFYITKRAFHRGFLGTGGRHTIGAETLEFSASGPTFYGGDILCFMYWPRRLNAVEVALVSTQVIMPYYGWTALPYKLPVQIRPDIITGWWSSRRNITCGTAEPTTIEWMDMLGRIPITAGGTPIPVNGVAGFNGTDAEYNTSAGVGPAFLTNSQGTIAGRVAPTTISTNIANPWQNVVIFADESGFIGVHLRNNAGTRQQLAYLNDTGGVKVQVATIPGSGVEYTFIVRYTAQIGGQIRQEINAVEGVPTATVGAITNITFPTRVGGKTGNNTQQYAGQMVELITYMDDLTDLEAADLRTYLNAQV